MYKLRNSNLNDIDLINKYYELAKLDSFCVWNEFYPTKEDILIDINNKMGYVLVDDFDNIIGGLSIEINETFKSNNYVIKDNFIEISRLFIRCEYQGNNLSLLMIDELIKLIKPKSIHLAVEINNIKAIINYKKYGFSFIDKINQFDHDYYLCEIVL